MKINIVHLAEGRLINVLERIAIAQERRAIASERSAEAHERMANAQEMRRELVRLTAQLKRSNDELASHVAAKTPATPGNKGEPKDESRPESGSRSGRARLT